MRGKAALLFLMLGVSFSEPYIFSSIHPQENFGDFYLHYSLVNESEDVLQVFSLRCEIDDGVKCPLMRPYSNEVDGELIWEGRISSEGEIQLNINEPALYKVCVRLKNNPKYDCDGDNYVLIKKYVVKTKTVKKTIILEKNITFWKREPEIDLVKIGDVIQFKPFNATYLVHNPLNQGIDVQVYSFSYENGTYITLKKPWDKANLHIPPNSTFFGNLTNAFVKKGTHLFKIRMIWNNTKYTDYMWVNVSCLSKPHHQFFFADDVVGVNLYNDGTCEETFLVGFDSLKKYTLTPRSKKTITFNRSGGELNVCYHDKCYSKEIYTSKITGRFTSTEKDLSEIAVLLSSVLLVYLVWKI